MQINCIAHLIDDFQASLVEKYPSPNMTKLGIGLMHIWEKKLSTIRGEKIQRW